MAKQVKGNNNIVITGNKNTMIQSPVLNVNSKIVNKIDKPANAITEEQAYEIKRLVDEVVKNTALPYPAVWRKFKAQFKVSEYKAMSADKYNDAKKLKSIDIDAYRKKRYTAIHSSLIDYILHL